MTDPELQADGGQRTAPQRRRSRRLLAVPAAMAAVLTAVMVVRAGDDAAVVRVGQAPVDLPAPVPTLPVPTVAVPPVPPAPGPNPTAPAPPPREDGSAVVPVGGRRQIAVDPRGRWTLYDVGRCLELEQERARFEGLLCDVRPTSEVLGDLAAVATPAGRVIVAVADPSVTGFHSYPRQAGGFFYDSASAADADSAGLAYLAGFAAPGATDLLVKSEPHTIARVLVPAADRAYSAAELQRTTAAPYGRWRAYRQAALTGFYFGGTQELGFYTNADGQPCVLYRRFAGPAEAMLADGCVRSGTALPVAALSRVRLPQFEDAFVLLALTDLDGVVLTIEFPDGTALAPPDVGRHADATGSGWAGLAQFAQHVKIPRGVRQVDFVLTDRAGVERARNAVVVPGR